MFRVLSYAVAVFMMVTTGEAVKVSATANMQSQDITKGFNGLPPTITGIMSNQSPPGMP